MRFTPRGGCGTQNAVMKINFKNLFAVLLAAVVLPGGNALAAEPISKSTTSKSPTNKSTASATTLTKAQITAIDKDELTFTVAGATGQKDLVIQLTSQTRIFRGKSNATTADLKVGQKISGSLRKSAAGKLEAVRLQLEDTKSATSGDEKSAPKNTKPAPKKS